VRGRDRHELPEFASLEPPEPVEPVEPLPSSLPEVVFVFVLVFVLALALAVGVAEVVLSVSAEPAPSWSPVEAELEAVCVAFGTAAATANEPATPLTATTAVTVAVRILPCRTVRAAPSASMAVLHRGVVIDPLPTMAAPDEEIMSAAWAVADFAQPHVTAPVRGGTGAGYS
jgi:hypothetical protein